MVGGARAQPFVTRFTNYGNAELQLRISPELYLKQLVVGGIDRVYEIGKQFRNEGIGRQHNPEFTSCEFYQAYGTLDDLMETTETLIAQLVRTVGTDAAQLGVSLDAPFRRVHVLDALEDALGGPLPDLEQPDALEQLKQRANKAGMDCTSVFSMSRMLDKLISHFVEPTCHEPTFLTYHPEIMSPLARSIVDDKGRTVSSRFELIIKGQEYANAYEELNDPQKQERRFALQFEVYDWIYCVLIYIITDNLQSHQNRNDDEAIVKSPNQTTSTAWHYSTGMPPTAGWGLGVDRLVALLCGTDSIKDVLHFPMTKGK